MQPTDDYPTPEPATPGPGAGWLNGTIWGILVLCWLAAITGDIRTAYLIGPFIWVVLAGGAALNLGYGLWLLATGRQAVAQPYFVGFGFLVLLGLLALWQG